MRIWPEKTVDQEFADLGTAGWSGTLNDRQFAYLRNAGYTGGLADMMFQLRTTPVIPAFTPASLFTGTDEGFWADVTPSRLWQDVARTTPVTAAGQSVASWELTTRTGVIYAEQATAGLRPTYELDTNNVPFLLFNGDSLTVPTITPASDKCQWFGGIQTISGSITIIFETSPVTDSNNGTLAVIMNNVNQARFRSKGTILSDATTGNVITSNTKNVWTGLGDISADSAIFRLNGTQQATSATDQGTGNFLAYQSFIGSRAGTGFFANFRLYGMALRYGPNLTAGQLTDMEGWMNSVLNP